METQTHPILVVDDEPAIRMLLRDNLEMAGYAVEEAEDGKVAWDLLSEGTVQYATVILDRMMPNLNGFQLLECIKTNPRLHWIPVILQTALGQRHDVVEGLRAGAYYYLVKPYDHEVMLSIVETAVADFERHLLVVEQTRQGQSTLGLLLRAEYAFRTMHEARALAATLSNAFPQPERAAMGLLELFINAVEHGNLGLGYRDKGELQATHRWIEELERRSQEPGLRDRVVNVRVNRQADRIEVEVEDEGDGFDWREYTEMSPERAGDTHGRGIAMARALSFDTLEYLGKGNLVRVTTVLDRSGA